MPVVLGAKAVSLSPSMSAIEGTFTFNGSPSISMKGLTMGISTVFW